jgi:ABC-type sulfate transport system substrate-binding protein
LLSRTAESTGGRRSLGDVLADFEKSIGLVAEKARGCGLIDSVVPARTGIVSFPRAAPRLGFRSS